MKRLLLNTALLLTALQAQAVIYRHDVPEDKYRALAAQPQFACVGQVMGEDQGGSLGSCVLIGDRYVLTAAHVLKTSITRPDTMMINGQQIVVFQQVSNKTMDAAIITCRIGRRRYQAKSITLHNDLLSATKFEADLALIELAEPVTTITPATITPSITGANGDELHSTVTFVGFGASGNAAVPEEVDVYGYKLAGQNIIDSLQGDWMRGRPTMLGFDFDHPGKPKYNAMGSDKALPLEAICGGGDSGGGMFRETAKGWDLVGICSGARTDVDLLLTIGYYGNTATYIRMSVFNQWVKDTVAKLEKERLATTAKQ